MLNKLKRFSIRYAITYAALVAAFITALTIVCSLPDGNIRRHAAESVPLMREEGWDNFIYGNNRSKIDGFTDQLMLEMEVAVDPDHPYESAIVSYREDFDYTGITERVLSGGAPVTDNYGRYWHGWQVWLRPLLEFVNYEQSRNVMFAVLAGLILACCFFLWRRLGLAQIIPFILMLWSACFAVVPNCWQYFSVYAVAFAASIYILIRFKPDGGFIGKMPHRFFIIGALAEFFDLLSAPLLTFGIPAVVLCLLLAEKGGIKKVWDGVWLLAKSAVAWVFGYLGLWVTKWVVADLTVDAEAKKLALGQIAERTLQPWAMVRDGFKQGLFRTGGDVTTLKQHGEIINANLDRAFGSPVVFWALALAALLVVGYYAYTRRSSLLFLFVSAMTVCPFAWYYVFANHSSIHVFMTYRAASIAAYALTGGITAALYAMWRNPAAVPLTAESVESDKAIISERVTAFISAANKRVEAVIPRRRAAKKAKNKKFAFAIPTSPVFWCNAVIFVLFVFYSIWLIKIHEPWRDEAQTWLMARDMGLGDLFAQLRYEGHPFLWFVLMMPFAKIGLPYFTQTVIHALFLFGAAWLICFRSKFHPAINGLLLVGTPMLYTINAIVRTYSPTIFFVLLAVTIFDERFGKRKILYAASLFCAANLTVFGAVSACALYGADVLCQFAPFVTSRGKVPLKSLFTKPFITLSAVVIGGLLIFAVTLKTGFFSPFIEVQQRFDIYTIYERTAKSGIDPANITHRFTDVMNRVSLGWGELFGRAFLRDEAQSWFYGVFAVVFGVLPVLAAKRERKLFAGAAVVINLGLTIALLVISPTLYYYTRYGAVTLFTFVGIYMLAVPSDLFKKRAGIILASFLAVGMLYNVRGDWGGMQYDRGSAYSGSRDAAKTIKELGYDRADTLIVAGAIPHVSSINPYLKNVKAMLYPQGFRSFSRWQEIPEDASLMKNLDYEALADKGLTQNPNYKLCLIIVLQSEDEAIARYDGLYPKIYHQTGAVGYDEGYVIYRYK